MHGHHSHSQREPFRRPYTQYNACTSLVYSAVPPLFPRQTCFLNLIFCAHYICALVGFYKINFFIQIFNLNTFTCKTSSRNVNIKFSLRFFLALSVLFAVAIQYFYIREVIDPILIFVQIFGTSAQCIKGQTCICIYMVS